MFKTILYFLSFISLGIISGSIGPTLPALAVQTQVEMKQISNLFVARSFGTLLGAWVLGRIYDRISGHPLLAVSLLASALAMALLPASNLLWVMIALSAFIGFASSSINVGGNTLIVMVYGTRVRPFISLLHFAFGVGGILAPLIVYFFAGQADSLKLTYWTFALLGLPPALMALLSPSPPHRAEQDAETRAGVPRMTLALLVLFFFLEVGAEANLMGWLYSYTIQQGIRSETATQINSAFWAAFTAGRLATIWLSMRFTALPMVRVALCLAMIFAAGMIVFPGTEFLLWACALGLGFSIAPIFPSTFGFAQSRLHLSGKVNGLFLLGAASGAMFWPRLIGQFFESVGAKVMNWVVLLNLICALAVIIIVSLPVHYTQEEKLVV